MKLLRQILSLEPELMRVAHAQNDVIFSLNEELRSQRLMHTRATRDLIAQFLDVLEGEYDEDILRDNLTLGLRDLSDEVARLEEHAPR